MSSSLAGLSLDPRGPRLTLGLRPLDLDQWLDVDEHYGYEMARKHRLLSTRHDDVVAYRDEGLVGSQEVLHLVQTWLARHHPGLGAAPLPGLHPIDAAGRLVQEDLCVMSAASGTWWLTAASVCSPSRWNLREKVATSLGQIHDPVPGYHEKIAAVVERSLDRLDENRPMWRLNWTLVDDPRLFQPSAPAPTEEPGAPRHLRLVDLTLRLERQTLRRLPRSGAVLFTIRTYRHRLDHVVARPGLARDLAATLRACSPETARYKGWTDLLPALLDTLDTVSGEDATPG